MIGQTLRHYTIVEQIGAGGMGVVYRAYDNELKRDVAIKVLADVELADESARRRFRTEALTLSRSEHPHIAVVHEFNADGAVNYIVMEYIPGQTLSDRLREGRLDVPMVVQLGRELTEGVAAAHRQGVVHRDLKPSNLRVTPDGHLKILDFGIAQWSSVPDAATKSGTDPGIAGTLPYMAPEQVRGQHIDGAVDVYAIGAVLYEMATGRRAHGGKNSAETLDSVLHRMPPRFATDPRALQLEACIFKALEKNPEHRYQSARELLVDLKRIELGTGGLPDMSRRRRPRLGLAATAAVLLSATMLLAVLWWSGRPGRETLTALPTAQKIAVLPAQVSGSPDAPPEWSQLIQSLFSDQLTGIQDLGVVDAFSIRSLLGGANSGTSSDDRIRERFGPAGITLVIDSQVRQQTAGYELRATVHNLSTGEQQFGDRALFTDEASLDRAVATVSNNVITFLQLQVFNLAADKNLRPWLEFRNRNIQAVKAFAQANEYTVTNQPELGERHLDRAIELDPSYVAPRMWRISSLVQRGLREPAETHYRELLKLEVNASPFEQAMIAYAGALISGDADEQIRQLERTLAFTPGNFILLVNLGGRQARKGDCRAALDAFEPLIAARWRFALLYSFWGYCAIDQGHLQRAVEVLTETPSNPQIAILLEAAYTALGDAANAARYSDAKKLAGDEKNPFIATLYEHLAVRAEAERREDVAVRLWDKAIAYEPTIASYRTRLAAALVRQGRIADAERAYHEALKVDAGALPAYLGLAEIAEGRRELTQAADRYRALIARAPQSPEAAAARERLARIGQQP